MSGYEEVRSFVQECLNVLPESRGPNEFLLQDSTQVSAINHSQLVLPLDTKHVQCLSCAQSLHVRLAYAQATKLSALSNCRKLGRNWGCNY